MAVWQAADLATFPTNHVGQLPERICNPWPNRPRPLAQPTGHMSPPPTTAATCARVPSEEKIGCNCPIVIILLRRRGLPENTGRRQPRFGATAASENFGTKLYATQNRGSRLRHHNHLISRQVWSGRTSSDRDSRGLFSPHHERIHVSVEVSSKQGYPYVYMLQGW